MRFNNVISLFLYFQFYTFNFRKRAHSPNEQNGQGSPTGSIYYGQSQRSSTFSLNEEIISQHPHFVKDTSKYWYKPNISREEGTFKFII